MLIGTKNQLRNEPVARKRGSLPAATIWPCPLIRAVKASLRNRLFTWKGNKPRGRIVGSQL